MEKHMISNHTLKFPKLQNQCSFYMHIDFSHPKSASVFRVALKTAMVCLICKIFKTPKSACTQGKTLISENSFNLEKCKKQSKSAAELRFRKKLPTQKDKISKKTKFPATRKLQENSKLLPCNKFTELKKFARSNGKTYDFQPHLEISKIAKPMQFLHAH